MSAGPAGRVALVDNHYQPSATGSRAGARWLSFLLPGRRVLTGSRRPHLRRRRALRGHHRRVLQRWQSRTAGLYDARFRRMRRDERLRLCSRALLTTLDADWYSSPDATGRDVVNLTPSGARVLRGGPYDFALAIDSLRAAFRMNSAPSNSSPIAGLRCAR